MAADIWTFYNGFKEALGDGTIDLDTDTLNVALFLSTSNAQTVTQLTFASLTNELVAAGYTAAGQAVAGLTWGQTAGVATLDFNDILWTFAAGATFRTAVLYSVTAAPNDLIAFSLLDNSPADIVIGAGNVFTLQLDPLGSFTLSG